MAGKRIGIPIRPGMPIDFQKYVAIRGISQHLQEEGLAISDVTIVPVACRERTVEQSESLNIAKREFEGCTEEFKAVLEGICEAAFANSVKALRLEESGDFRNVVEPNKQIAINSRNNNSPLLITASHRVIDEHPEIVAAYMDLSIQKSVFLQDNPEAYYNVVSSGVYEATPKELKTVYNEDAHKLRCPALGVKELTAVEDQVRFLYDSGAIENIVDVSKWINVVFLT